MHVDRQTGQMELYRDNREHTVLGVDHRFREPLMMMAASYVGPNAVDWQ